MSQEIREPQKSVSRKAGSNPARSTFTPTHSTLQDIFEIAQELKANATTDINHKG